MTKRWSGRQRSVPPRDSLGDDQWEQIVTVETIAGLMDRTPAELLEAAYNGSPERFDLEYFLQGGRRY